MQSPIQGEQFKAGRRGRSEDLKGKEIKQTEQHRGEGKGAGEDGYAWELYY